MEKVTKNEFMNYQAEQVSPEKSVPCDNECMIVIRTATQSTRYWKIFPMTSLSTNQHTGSACCVMAAFPLR